MWNDEARERLGQIEVDEWVTVTAKAEKGWVSDDPRLCPWHKAFAAAGLPVLKYRCSVTNAMVNWNNRQPSPIPPNMRLWIHHNDNGHNPAPLTVRVNRRTLEIRDL